MCKPRSIYQDGNEAFPHRSTDHLTSYQHQHHTFSQKRKDRVESSPSVLQPITLPPCFLPYISYPAPFLSQSLCPFLSLTPSFTPSFHRSSLLGQTSFDKHWLSRHPPQEMLINVGRLTQGFSDRQSVQELEFNCSPPVVRACAMVTAYLHS